MEILIGLVAAVVVALALGALLRKRSPKITSRSVPTSSPTRPTGDAVVPGEQTIPLAQTPSLTEGERQYGRMKDALRDLFRSSATKTSSMLGRVVDSFQGALTKEEILGAALEVGFDHGIVVETMAQHGFQPHEIVKLVDEQSPTSFDIPQLFESLFKAVPAMANRSRAIFEALDDTYELDKEDLSAFVKCARATGCPDKEIVDILKDSLEFPTLLLAFGVEDTDDGSQIAKLAEASSANLLEEYSSLRDTYSLGTVSNALRATGATIDAVLDEEASHLDSHYDTASDALFDMEDSRFSKSEILKWLAQSEHSDLNSDDVLAEAFQDELLPEEELLSLALSLGDVDPSEVEEKLRESGVAFEDRIEFLHRLFTTTRKAEEGGGPATDQTGE